MKTPPRLHYSEQHLRFCLLYHLTLARQAADELVRLQMEKARQQAALRNIRAILRAPNHRN